MHSWRELSFFLMKRIGAAWEDEVGWMKPKQRFSLMNAQRVLSSIGERV